MPSLPVDGGLGRRDGAGHRLLGRLVGARPCTAVAPQGREHLVGDPALEGLGLGLAGTHDEFVEAGLGDGSNLLVAARGVD